MAPPPLCLNESDESDQDDDGEMFPSPDGDMLSDEDEGDSARSSEGATSGKRDADKHKADEDDEEFAVDTSDEEDDDVSRPRRKGSRLAPKHDDTDDDQSSMADESGLDEDSLVDDASLMTGSAESASSHFTFPPCTLCNQPATDAMQLLCAHTACAACAAHSSICLTCHQSTSCHSRKPKRNEEQEEGLRPDYGVRAEYAFAAVKKQAKTKGLCEVCEELCSSMVCHDCDCVLCTDCCHRLHSKGKMRTHRTHRLQLGSGKCRQHSEELLRFVCRDCSSLCCGICVIDKHSGHAAVTIDDGVEILEDILERSKEKLSLLSAGAGDALTVLNQQDNLAREKHALCRSEITSAVSRLIAQLREKETLMLQETDAVFGRAKRLVKSERRRVQVCVERIEEAKRQLNMTASAPNHPSLVGLAAGLEVLSDELTEIEEPSTFDLTMPEMRPHEWWTVLPLIANADAAISRIRLGHAVDFDQSLVVSPTKRIRQGHPYKFMVSLRGHDGEPLCGMSSDIQVKIRFAKDDQHDDVAPHLVTIQEDGEKAGVYNVEFTPVTIHILEVRICMFGEHLRNSPLILSATSCPDIIFCSGSPSMIVDTHKLIKSTEPLENRWVTAISRLDIPWQRGNFLSSHFFRISHRGEGRIMIGVISSSVVTTLHDKPSAGTFEKRGSSMFSCSNRCVYRQGQLMVSPAGGESTAVPPTSLIVVTIARDDSDEGGIVTFEVVEAADRDDFRSHSSESVMVSRISCSTVLPVRLAVDLFSPLDQVDLENSESQY